MSDDSEGLSKLVAAAVEEEHRLTVIEQRLEHLINLSEELNRRVGIQNGRVATNEGALAALLKRQDESESTIKKIQDTLSKMSSTITGVVSNKEAATRREVAIVGAIALLGSAAMSNLDTILRLLGGG